ncbi:MAG: hypothetical protein EZS28_005406 [Streblomastix strix]|uniref:Uncharacterized protein n=1 Tax=Streblomastix strix TaxID=222440 RepID=A0A5J4WVN1_9EUKA|nr:MAG: hypothetical protein EZS28_005406 [Streblomastix strix]
MISSLKAFGRWIRLANSSVAQQMIEHVLPIILIELKKDNTAEQYAAVIGLRGAIQVGVNVCPQSINPYIQEILKQLYQLLITLPLIYPTALVFPPQPAQWRRQIEIILNGEQNIIENEKETKEINSNEQQQPHIDQSILQDHKDSLHEINDKAIVDIEMSIRQRLSIDIYSLLSIMGLHYPDETIIFLLQSLQPSFVIQSQQQMSFQRSALISALAHIVSVCGVNVISKRQLIIGGEIPNNELNDQKKEMKNFGSKNELNRKEQNSQFLSQSLSDSSIQVQFAIVELVLSLSRNGFLIKEDKGCQGLIRSLIHSFGAYRMDYDENKEQKHQKEQLVKSIPTATQLSLFASDCLYEMCTNHIQTRDLLWNYLFEFIFIPRSIIPSQSTNTIINSIYFNPPSFIPSVTFALSYIAQQKRDNQNDTNRTEILDRAPAIVGI